jgi:type IV pilus assembly protein PilE
MKLKAGFTLVEVLVVVAIIGILGAIAYPLYNSQIEKSRRSDARGALLEIVQAEERFFTMNGIYTDDLTELPLDAILQSAESESGYYDIVLAHIGGDTATFQVTANPKGDGPQADDEKCTQLTVNHLGVKSGKDSIGKDGDACW